MAATKVLYKREPVSDISTLEELLAYVQRELDAVERGFALTLPKEIDWMHAEPAKLREGLTVGADGTDWNPGSGQGVYTYYNAAWRKLG